MEQIIKDKINSFLDRLEEEHDISIVYAVESGSRAWGFKSEDSDYDVRFFYISRPEKALFLPGSKRPDDHVSWMSEDRLYDMHGWDIGKALQNLYKQNPCLSEWLVSPEVYRNLPNTAVEWMHSKLFTHYNDKAAIYHYIHMATGNFTKYLSGPKVPMKKYLYVIRPLLCCEYILKHKVPPPMDIYKLLEIEPPGKYRDAIDALVQKKLEAGHEMGEVFKIPVLDDYIQSKLQFFNGEAANLAVRLSAEERSQLFADATEQYHNSIRSAIAGYVKPEWRWL